MKTFKILSIIGIITFTFYSFTNIVQDEWVVPEEYVNMTNPTDPSVDLDIGKSLYSKHCKSCHGKEGYGDGPKAEEQEGDLGDFSSEEYQAQTDGELFYKTSFGRNDMPDYTKKSEEINEFIKDLDINILAMVNYKHSFIEGIIKEPVIKKLGFHPIVPFLVIPE